MNPSFFNPLEPPGAERLRGTGTIRFTYDEHGEPAALPENAVSISRSPDGSIDDIHGGFDSFYHCGHPRTAPLGTKCAIEGCNRLSCQACSARCQRCLVPLCLEHVCRLQTEPGRELTLCSSCHDQVARTLRWKAVGRFLIQPFVAFGNKPQP
jgi:hypothetical protein